MSWAMLLPLFVFALLLLCAVAGVVLLLVFPRSRTVGLGLLSVGGAVTLLTLLALAWLSARWSLGSPQRIAHVDVAAAEALPSASTPRPSPAAAEKGEDEYSQAVAARAVGMLRAMVHALSQALVEEEKTLAAKKGGAKPPAAPVKRPPDWVDAPPRSLHGVYQVSVVVGPYTSRAECDAQLPDALQEALDRYAEVCLGGQVEEPVLLPPDQLRRLVKEQWEEVRQYSVGPMLRLHALLEFDRKVKDCVLEEHKRAVVASRLRLTGIGLTAGLALLGVFFGYLKATATRTE